MRASRCFGENPNGARGGGGRGDPGPVDLGLHPLTVRGFAGQTGGATI